MRILIGIMLQFMVLTLYAQKNSSVNLSLYNSYLSSETQIEIRTIIYPKSFKLGIDLSVSTNFDENFIVKAGLVFNAYRNNRLSFNIGTRISLERFYENDFNTIQVAHNVEIPLSISYDFLPNFYLSGSVVPTSNNYYNYRHKVALNYSFGLGYYF